MKNVNVRMLSDGSSENGRYNAMRNNIIRLAAASTAVVFGLLLLTSCYKVVGPGHVGIVVKQSGSDRGVQDFPVQSGRVWYNPVNEVVLSYPTYVQRAIWTSSLQEGAVCSLAGLSTPRS